MKKSEVTKLFNKFAGKTLQHPMMMTADPTLGEMAKVARDNGLVLSVHYGDKLTAEQSALRGEQRVNIYTKQDANNQFVITKKITLG